MLEPVAHKTLYFNIKIAVKEYRLFYQVEDTAIMFKNSYIARSVGQL